LRLLIDSEPLLLINKGALIYKNMKKAKSRSDDGQIYIVTKH